MQADSLPAEPPGKPEDKFKYIYFCLILTKKLKVFRSVNKHVLVALRCTMKMGICLEVMS